MSRWTKKWNSLTEDEKQKQLDERQSQTRRSITEEFIKYKQTFNDKDALKIYNRGSTPIACPHCLKWSSSFLYIIQKDETPDGSEHDMLVGVCNGCQNTIKRVLPSLGSDEGLLFCIAVQNLIKAGRLKDKRTRTDKIADML